MPINSPLNTAKSVYSEVKEKKTSYLSKYPIQELVFQKKISLIYSTDFIKYHLNSVKTPVAESVCILPKSI